MEIETVLIMTVVKVDLSGLINRQSCTSRRSLLKTSLLELSVSRRERSNQQLLTLIDEQRRHIRFVFVVSTQNICNDCHVVYFQTIHPCVLFFTFICTLELIDLCE